MDTILFQVKRTKHAQIISQECLCLRVGKSVYILAGFFVQCMARKTELSAASDPAASWTESQKVPRQDNKSKLIQPFTPTLCQTNQKSLGQGNNYSFLIGVLVSSKLGFIDFQFYRKKQKEE